MFGEYDYQIHFYETSKFLRDTKRLFVDEELEELKRVLALTPKLGDLIPHTGGARKLRWALGNRGKSHGARIVYYFHEPTTTMFLFSAYAKSSKISLRGSEKQEVKKLIKELAECQSQTDSTIKQKQI